MALALAGAAALALTAVASAATIRGSQRADLLHGTARADRILARGGADRIVAQLGARDTVACGAGRDLISADLADRVARDCETVVRQVARDPLSGALGQHETVVEPDGFAFGSTVVTTFQVGRIQDGGAEAIGFATSRDGGRTWRSGLLPRLTQAAPAAGPWERASDPVVAFDALHGVWLIATLALTPPQRSSLLVSRSSDGLVWDPPVTVASAPGPLSYDKQWLVCDNGPASPFRGRCYMSYSDLGPAVLGTQTSTDGGLTWGAAVAPPGGVGRASILGPLAPAPQPLVRPDGALVVPLLDGLNVVAVRSTDGGATFSGAIPITTMATSPGGELLRAPPLPSAEIDAAGTIYLTWADCRFRSACSADDIVLSRSNDGLTWTPPERIPIDRVSSGIDHMLPGIAVDPSSSGGGARLGLVYYTLRNGRLDVGYVSSHNGGATWSAARRLSPESMPLEWLAAAGGRFAGDYMSASFAAGRVVPIFVLATRPDRRFHEAPFSSVLPVG